MKFRTGIQVLALSPATAGSAAAQDTGNWSGWYGGGYGGYIFGKLTSNDPTHFTTTGQFDDNGATAASGKTLPPVFAAAGLMSAEGLTLNIDENDQYSPGFVQKASATHFVSQIGAGIDRKTGEKWMLGARGACMKVAAADHTMSWNSPGPNKFGLNCMQVQVNLGRQF